MYNLDHFKVIELVNRFLMMSIIINDKSFFNYGVLLKIFYLCQGNVSGNAA